MRKRLFPVVYGVFVFILLSVRLFSYEWKTTWFDSDTDHEYIENIDDYNSVINWTTGKVIAESTLSISYDDPNIGRQFNEYTHLIRNDLQEKLLKALGYLRISDLFLLKDYYSRQSSIRYEIVANVDNAFYYPPIINQDEYYGVAELDLYGENGMANLFYRDLERVDQEKYLNYSEDKEIDYYDGLIIDTIAFTNFQPSVRMRILDEDGTVLYGAETVEEEYLKNYGVCEYTSTLNYAFASERSGDNIYYVMPRAIEGSMGTEIVIDNKDAARLFANQKTIDNLNQSQVVIVKPMMEE